MQTLWHSLDQGPRSLNPRRMVEWRAAGPSGQRRIGTGLRPRTCRTGHQTAGAPYCVQTRHGQGRHVPNSLDSLVEVARMRYWDETTHAFVAEPGTYELRAGSSSQDLPLTASFNIDI
jgi:Fibronectin type III-like domain